MLRRNVAYAAVALLFLAAGCGDSPTRATGPRDGQVQLNLNQDPTQHSYYVQWLSEFTPEGNIQGTANSLFNAIQDAENQGAALNALIGYLMANYSSLRQPTRPPSGDGSLASELAAFLTAVAEFYGLIPEIDVTVEHLITIVGSDDVPATGGKCFPTNLGNAAMCLNKSSLTFPAFISIIEQETGQGITLPPGFAAAGKVFHYDAYGAVAGEVVVLLCTPSNHSHTTNYGLARSVHGENNFESKPNNAGADFPGECESFQPQARLLNGDGVFARGINAAGSFLLSALSPKAAYATHSLAHRGTAFSDWLLTENDAVTVKVVGVNSGTFTSTSFNVGRNTGNITFYVEVYLNGVLETCGASNTNVVKAIPKFSSTLTGVEVTATACAYHGSSDTHRHQITFTNLRQGTNVTNGTLSFTVNGFTATGVGGATVTFTTN